MPQWEQQYLSPALVADPPLHYNYFGLPSPSNSAGSTGTNSPVPPHRMLKMRMTPDYMSENDQLQCIPTHQVFDFPEVQNPPSPESTSPSPLMQSRSISIGSSTAPSKREHSPSPSVTKKPRAVGERITTKDFVPPDVSGLSKRETRLVKNRAAAFISRQRKREEFETMEMYVTHNYFILSENLLTFTFTLSYSRVAELEQENTALRALTQNGSHASSHPKSDDKLLSEIEQLRIKLAAAEKRQSELNAELERQAEARHSAIKVEAAEPQFPPSTTARSAPVSTPHKTGASLGLMVLLCALPTLLSMPTQNTLPTSFSFPISGSSALPASSSAFDFNSVIASEYDWSHNPSGTMMDLDVDDQGRITTNSKSISPTEPHILQFVDGASDALGLGNLDISFDASPSENGKIRVRIHSSPSDFASVERLAKPGSRQRSSSSSSLSMWAGAQIDSTFSDSFGPSALSSFPPPSSALDRDPFLGANTAYGLCSPMSLPMSMSEISSPAGLSQRSTYGSAFDYTYDTRHASGKRRVRIALKSMPTAGGEGGEWEVEVR
jgi:hypothetical protein